MIAPPFRFVRAGRLMRELSILSAIGESERISQRRIALRSRLSTTMVNTYLAELVAGGMVSMTGETNRDVRYILTGPGRERLTELTHHCSKEVVQFYGLVKKEFQRRLEALAGEGIRRVVLFGAAETSEVTCAASAAAGIDVVGVVDNDPTRHGRVVGACRVGSPETIETIEPDAVLITSHGHANAIEAQLRPLEGRGIRVRRVWGGVPAGDAESAGAGTGGADAAVAGARALR